MIPPQDLFRQILHAIESMGTLGFFAFVPFFVVASLFFVPNPVLAFAAGALFGLPAGFAVASASSLLSAGALFLAGRYFSRGWIAEKIEANEKLKAVDDAVSREGWKMVALLRFTAVLPFTAMNYGLGLSKIKFTHYLAASWAGMAPGVLLYVYFGSLAGNMAAAGTGRREKSPAEWVLLGAGVLATVGVSLYASWVVKNALKKKAV
jgi:uncharacterized membrane protein YdjX (TVP38/TMEM64 family)